jgi:polysaccharide deacetylase family protein (PEP-CTERM system associated)
MSSMINAFTVDLEDWFHPQNLQSAIGQERWPACEMRIVDNTRRLLDLLERFKVEATFFVLGWIAERVPFLIREIGKAGHEIACHGYSHTLLTRMTADSFRSDVQKALDVTAPLADAPIIGYRAPTFTITRATMWAVDVLKDRGMIYDSSVYPIGHHPDYGMPDAPLSIYRHENSLIEVPISCVEILGQCVPCGGGGYFRLFPYRVFRKMLKACNSAGRPAIFYVHPWEIDPGQPRVSIPLVKRFRHYLCLDKTFDRLQMLLEDFRFTSIRNLLQLRGDIG